MRVVCLVPSMTETLIESGIQVVGRTRFCIHPAEAVKSIASLGGTKGVNWLEVEKLKPDLVIFDQEENKKEMAMSCPFPWVATHVNSLESLMCEFENLANRLNNEKLRELKTRLQKF